MISESVNLKGEKERKLYAILVTEAYKAGKHGANGIGRSYEVLKDSNIKLFKRMLSKIDVDFVDDYEETGYSSAKDMIKRLQDSGVLRVDTRYSSNHDYFSEKENWMFRAVHDYYTHILRGKKYGHAFNFDLKGEYQTYNTHANLAPKAALPALFSEVVAQVSYEVITGSFPDPQKSVYLFGFDFENVGDIDCKEYNRNFDNNDALKTFKESGNKKAILAYKYFCSNKELTEEEESGSKDFQKIKNIFNNKTRSWAIFSASKEGYDNEERNKELKLELKQREYSILDLEGVAQELSDEGGIKSVKEESFLVIGIPLKEVFELNGKYDQWGFIYSGPENGFSPTLYETSGAVSTVYKDVYNSKDNEFYSVYKGEPFYFAENKLKGGLADKKSIKDFDKDQLKKGIKVELEHTNNLKIAMEIAMDHLAEDPRYYDKLTKYNLEEEGGDGGGDAGGAPGDGGGDDGGGDTNSVDNYNPDKITRSKGGALSTMKLTTKKRKKKNTDGGPLTKQGGNKYNSFS